MNFLAHTEKTYSETKEKVTASLFHVLQLIWQKA